MKCKIMYYNELDAQFGYDCGPMVYRENLEKSVAKSMVRHLNSCSPDFIRYWVDYEVEDDIFEPTSGDLREWQMAGCGIDYDAPWIK